VNPSVPTPFDADRFQDTGKDPAHRYQSIDLLASDLYPLARRKAAAPVQPQHTSFRERATRLLRSA